MRALYAAGRQAEAIAAYHEGRELLADQLGVDPSALLEQVYLGILRGGEEPAPDSERAAVPAQARPSAARAQSPLTSFVGRDEDRRAGRQAADHDEAASRGPSADAYCPARPMSCRTWWGSRCTS